MANFLLKLISSPPILLADVLEVRQEPVLSFDHETIADTVSWRLVSETAPPKPHTSTIQWDCCSLHSSPHVLSQIETRVCSEFPQFGRVRETSGEQVRMRSSPKWRVRGVRPCRENENILKLLVNKRYIPIYSTITMIPTTLRYSPLFPVSVCSTAKIADPPKFPEHAWPGGTPEPRQRPISPKTISPVILVPMKTKTDH